MQQSAPGPLISATDFSDLILENMVERIIAFDTGFNVLQVNAAFARWTGISNEAAAGRSLFDLLPELDTVPRRAVLAQLQAGHTHFSNERYRSEDGYFEWRANPLRNSDGVVIGGLCLLRDITPVIAQFNEIGKLKTALHEKDVLLESRARLAEAILDHTHDYIAVLDAGLRYRAVNKAFLEYAGKTSAEMIGRHVLEVFPEMKDSVFHTDMLAALQGKPGAYKNIPFSKDRSRSANAFMIPLTFGDGLVYGVMLMTQDITELVQAKKEQQELNAVLQQQLELAARQEGELRSIFDATRDLVAIIGSDNRIVEMNHAFLKYLGISRTEVVGRDVMDAYGSRDRAADVYGALARCREGAVIVDDNHRFLLGDRRGRLSMVPLYDTKGTVTGVMAVIHDLTELLHNNAQLVATNSLLAQRNRELDAVIYAASHDLRAPVRKISYYLSVLEKPEGGAEERAAALGKISRSAGQMERLLQELVNYHRTLPDEATVPVDLDAQLREVAARLGLAANVRATGSLPVLQAQPGPLRLLFDELLTNAHKFRSPEKPLLVTVSSETITAAESNMLVLTVTDNGSGFNPSCNERVCDLFFRAHDAHTSGSGLGLSLCRKIMDAHGGSIAVEGRPGTGVTVRLSFPQFSGTLAG
ncbi:MAG: PAS domain S-box protein [Chitinophagaceae bacterium]|nr:MAG: PAS domain S-box protein [Chitinophagaceae bacterium]